ncbi:MAG TPA: asparagine--tRNA ligase [Candidatus Norongarragalinales archaeon]|jgi:asparaginyl-tRNA synthetase|nr:asparagine--tRNA ligase [Candidatus Norongarragalinales archaeon]
MVKAKHEEKFITVGSILDSEHDAHDVWIRGWIYRTRTQGGVSFILIRDKTSVIQCAVKKNIVGEEKFKDASKALIESAIEIKGKVVKDPRAPDGYELQASDVKVTHFAEPFPIGKDQSVEFLLDVRHLWLRSRFLTAAMIVKGTVLRATREWFNDYGYAEVTPPIIVSGACEGGSTLFKFDYFGRPAYLSQSAQLYLEAMIFSLEKVYSITPSFRAEKSRTIRHLAEYWHIEPEMAYYDLKDTMKAEEELISHICQTVAKENKKELKIFERKPEDLMKIKPPFERITYTEAVEELQKNGVKIEWGEDFGTEHERVLTEKRTSPLFVTHYPKDIKAFYVKEDPKDSKMALNNDCLAPEGYGEIISGSEREDDADKLIKRLKDEGVDLKSYQWYIDLRRFGSVPHSGFGMGLERLLRWMLKMDHIRDTIPFPRTINRAYP